MYTFGKVTRHILLLTPRVMSSDEYSAYKKWMTRQNQALTNSTREDSTTFAADCCVTNRGIKQQIRFGHIRYGVNSNLKESGCAVFCIQHARPYYFIPFLAYWFTKKGYVHTGDNGKCYGTWHHLLDRLGAVRLTDIQQIFNFLYSGKIITALVSGHFLNIVGISGTNFLVEDSRFSTREAVPFDEIFNSLRAAWVW